MIIKNKNNLDIIFKNDCNAIFDEQELRDAICWYSDKPVCKVKHIYMFGKYPAISIYDKKIHIHRLLKMYWLGTDIDKNFYVHHKNGNKLDSSLENLELVNKIEHQRLHNKNKIISEKQRKIISEANKKRKGMKLKKIIIPNLKQLLDKGYSINEIAKKYNLSWSSVKAKVNKLHENPELLED